MSDDRRFRLVFLGAARTVTGSMHLLEAHGRSVLVDCGMFQGHRQQANQRNRNVPRRAVGADAVVLTHAHIDHCGNLPTLVKSGFRGLIHATSATVDLCRAMLLDSARIQEADAAWLNRKNADDPDWGDVEPLYTQEDAERAIDRLVPHPYDSQFELWPGLRVRFIDAGHILGSASVVMDVKRNGHSRRVVFSGDIGRRNLPILRDPVIPPHPDYVVMETTYGARLHAPAEDMQKQLVSAIEAARARHGKIIVPSFALERAQEIVFALNQLVRDGRLKPIPVYVDSPLTMNVTQVFREHPECYDAETTAFDAEHGDPFGFHMLTMVESVEDSKALNNLEGPAIIISASGMCESGRVVHHLRNSVEDPRNMIMIVGYQAQHTLGRRLVERRDRVRIFGVERDLRAEVRVLNAFSAHADSDELLWWAQGCGDQVRCYYLVHGDEDQSEMFAVRLKKAGKRAVVPEMGQVEELE